jgi:molybdopterin-binding protein
LITVRSHVDARDLTDWRGCGGLRPVGPQKVICRFGLPAVAEYGGAVATFRISEAAALVGVSDDTVRRWAESGRLATLRDGGGRLAIDGRELARFAAHLGASVESPASEAPVVGESARNRFAGIVTRVIRDGVMAQVEIQAGPHRVVSLMSREAADDLALQPGVLAVAAVKATNVVVELPKRRP